MKWIGLALCVVVAIGAPTAFADEMKLPFGMSTTHLNLVLSVSDAEQTHRFYGEILGLKRIPDLNFPGETFMIRYLGGESEIKLIVTGQDLPKFTGGTGAARGIRLMAILLPKAEQAGIMERLKAHDHPAPSFTSGESAKGYGYEYGMVYDYDGNQIELVFLDERAPKDAFKGFQIGLTVSDNDAMNDFLSNIMGLEKIGEGKLSEDRTIHRYAMGRSVIKFWNATEELPAHVGGPFDVMGMNLVQFLVPDVDAVRAAVLERGGTINKEPYALGTMATIMFVDGPDGILFEFAGPLLPRLRQSK